jgi:hypothetical protein
MKKIHNSTSGIEKFDGYTAHIVRLQDTRTRTVLTLTPSQSSSLPHGLHVLSRQAIQLLASIDYSIY